MTSTAPYYQAASADYDETSHAQYNQPTDDFATLARLAEESIRGKTVEDEANDQLAGLLQAVNSATDPFGHTDPLAFAATSTITATAASAPAPTPAPIITGKRKRASHTPTAQSAENSKRAKQDPQQNAPHPSISAARAAGVHSAAALFRSPMSSATKKYTRPPMSKLYASLHLTPEDFLHLQAAAKTYMLDPDYPERQDCVGSRVKGDNDMVKLKLFNCVRDFLADGVGERFFPENAEVQEALTDGPGFGDEDTSQQQRWVWPKDGNQIVSLVTPLMRRMVTNERQRMYAHESRKGGGTFRKDQMEDDQAEPGANAELLDPTLHEDQPNSPTPLGASNGSTLQTRAGASPVIETARHQRLPPSCATNVIQFIFTHKDIKLLRFDWPDLEASPRHNHMTFDKLSSTVVEHAIGIRAAMISAGLVTDSQPFNYQLTPQAQMARTKAAESLSQARPRQSTNVDANVEQEASSVDATARSDDLGEELRRELQSQIGEAADPGDQSADEPQMQATDASLEGLGVIMKAFTPNGLLPVNDEMDWDSVRDEVSNCMWLEGCLRLAVDMP